MAETYDETGYLEPYDNPIEFYNDPIEYYKKCLYIRKTEYDQILKTPLKRFTFPINPCIMIYIVNGQREFYAIVGEADNGRKNAKTIRVRADGKADVFAFFRLFNGDL
jgi:hypothetical protein